MSHGLPSFVSLLFNSGSCHPDRATHFKIGTDPRLVKRAFHGGDRHIPPLSPSKVSEPHFRNARACAEEVRLVKTPVRPLWNILALEVSWLLDYANERPRWGVGNLIVKSLPSQHPPSELHCLLTININIDSKQIGSGWITAQYRPASI